MVKLPTPHGDKLTALLDNEKLPKNDKPRLQQAIQRYEDWIARLEAVKQSPHKDIATLVSLLE